MVVAIIAPGDSGDDITSIIAVVVLILPDAPTAFSISCVLEVASPPEEVTGSTLLTVRRSRYCSWPNEVGTASAATAVVHPSRRDCREVPAELVLPLAISRLLRVDCSLISEVGVHTPADSRNTTESHTLLSGRVRTLLALDAESKRSSDIMPLAQLTPINDTSPVVLPPPPPLLSPRCSTLGVLLVVDEMVTRAAVRLGSSFAAGGLATTARAAAAGAVVVAEAELRLKLPAGMVPAAAGIVTAVS